MDNNYENDKSYLDLISNIEKVQVKYAPEKADECKEAVLRAGELIHDFCYYEYGGSADFSDLVLTESSMFRQFLIASTARSLLLKCVTT